MKFYSGRDNLQNRADEIEFNVVCIETDAVDRTTAKLRNIRYVIPLCHHGKCAA